METMLVRLKPFDVRRGHVLRRYTRNGLRFDSARGWYRVEATVADDLRSVRQSDIDPHAPLAFDVATEDEARRMDTEEAAQTRPARATDDLPLSVPRSTAGVVTIADLPEGAVGLAAEGQVHRRGRKAQE